MSAEQQQTRRAQAGADRRGRTRARIVAAAFDLFGNENGLFVRIEDVADRAGVTRPTVYNHFTGMAELRDAVTHELTHDFLNAVTRAIAELTDPRERASAALRHYLHRVRAEPGWGWSIINLSANGIPFGAGTWREARATVQQGLDAGLLHVGDADTGRDLLLGASLAAVGALVRGNVPQDYPERIAAAILMGLGVAQYEAEAMARRPLPVLDMATSPN